jgi:hypothetical protein
VELRFTPVVLDGKSNLRQQSKISCATLERTQVAAKFITENVDLVNSIDVVKDSLLTGSAVSNLCGSPRVKTGPTDYWIARLAFGRAVECRARYVKRCQRSEERWSQIISFIQHWIRMELHPDVVVHSLKVLVDPADGSYTPSLLIISAADSLSGMKEVAAVSVGLQVKQPTTDESNSG